MNNILLKKLIKICEKYLGKDETEKLIKENPDLDIVIMASTQDLTDDYGYLLLEKLSVEVADIYNHPLDERIYFDKVDIIEELSEKSQTVGTITETIHTAFAKIGDFFKSDS